MNPLSLIPTSYLIGAAAAVGLSLAAWGGVQTHRLATSQHETREVKDAWAIERANASRVALVATTEAAAETKRRLTEQKEANDEAQRLNTRARSAATTASAAAVGLHDAAVAAAARRDAAARDPAPVAVGAPADPAGALLADVLGRIDAAAGEFAAALDLAYVAGKQCEREHVSLTDSPLKGLP
ncbi:MAG TPA: DUF2514 family protein [Burkholderiaceae bacterium]|nr:DUF2514 family protein [Burkholderiaceae bacterium]